MNDLILQAAEDRQETLRELLPEMMELGRMRSDFALEHFVVGQHDLPGRQRAQALVELQAMYFSLGEVYDDMRLTKLDLDENKRETERDRIKAEGLERKLLSISMSLRQRIKEIDYLIELLKKMPKYTADELEQEEPKYWAARLARQAFLAPRDPGGNLDAVLQLVTVPGEDKPILPAGPHEFMLGMGLEVGAVAKGLEKLGLITAEGRKLLEDTKPVEAKPPKRKHH